ncbi:fimbrial protein [Enterobacterales bacterium CwR94]|nr:fimbrial protein [Enterobacterales bacterium CwR94]
MFAQVQLKHCMGAALGFLILSTAAFAEKCPGPLGCTVPLTFKGTYLEDTCDVSIDNSGSDAVVGLPRIGTYLLQTDGKEAGSTPFQIALKNCPVGKNVNLFFKPAGIPVDDTTGNLTNTTGTGMSEFVQVRIRNAAGNQLRVGNSNDYQEYVIPPIGGDVTHYFVASYYAKGNSSVKPGLVKTLAGIELIYN